MVGWGGGRKGFPYKQGLFNHLLQGKHLAIVLGLDRSNGCSSRRCHCVCYWLLEERVHSLRVSYDFFKTGNCFSKLVCICDPERVVKTRGGRYCCFYFSFGDVKKRGIYWFGSSYTVNKLLQGRLNARSVFIACIMLKLVDGTGKAFGFCSKRKKTQSLKK